MGGCGRGMAGVRMQVETQILDKGESDHLQAALAALRRVNHGQVASEDRHDVRERQRENL